MNNSNAPVITVEKPQVEAIGGGLEGAERFDRETALWSPSMRSPDQVINNAKPLADARGRDMVQNDGYMSGAATLHKDNIVGHQYRLNAKPNWRVLGATPEWAEEFQVAVESRFSTVAESEECYFDAARRNTFTGLIRLGVGGFVITGEVLGTAEWSRETRRPFKTNIQLISPDRLSNPNGQSDDRFIRRGIRRDIYGRPLSFFIRNGHPTESYDLNSFSWKEVAAEKPWGRKMVIHIIDQLLPDQSRGVADMVAALKQMRMTKKFQEVTLQNAVVNASFAAAIESELPSGEVFATLGANSANGAIGGMQDYLTNYLGMLGTYLDGSKNIAIDGAKIPHLFPGTKLNLQPVGTPGGVGSSFEESLLRHTAAALGLSYEQFSRDYTKTNYSSARASMNETWKFMQSRKKAVADRLANNIYALWLEEEIAAGNLPLPAGKDRNWFYQPLVKDALTQCAWIGASRGQIDESKETDAALARIEGGLSTFEIECSRLGQDFRDIFEQRSREKKLMNDLGLSFGEAAKKPAQNAAEPANGKKANQDEQDSQN
jgi:lambda family phage portal protein